MRQLEVTDDDRFDELSASLTQIRDGLRHAKDLVALARASYARGVVKESAIDEMESAHLEWLQKLSEVERRYGLTADAVLDPRSPQIVALRKVEQATSVLMAVIRQQARFNQPLAAQVADYAQRDIEQIARCLVEDGDTATAGRELVDRLQAMDVFSEQFAKYADLEGQRVALAGQTFAAVRQLLLDAASPLPDATRYELSVSLKKNLSRFLNAPA